MSLMLEKYKGEVIPKMKEKFGYKNSIAVPRILKVVINTGTGRTSKDEKIQEAISQDLALIGGQKPIPTLAKGSISEFKIREGMPIGFKITLRGKRMYEFLDRFIGVAIPRIRDFRGLPLKSIDRGGNLSVGIKEQIVFPEASQEAVKSIFGLEVAIATNAKIREEAVELFKLLGFPLQKSE